MHSLGREATAQLVCAVRISIACFPSGGLDRVTNAFEEYAKYIKEELGDPPKLEARGF